MKKKYQELIEELGQKRAKANLPLKKYTTFNIGGPADLFYQAKTTDDLVKAVFLCRQLKIPFFILGGGSNILVSDQGFRGLVIKNEAKEIKLLKSDRVRVAAGTLNSQLLSFCRDYSLSGIEFLAGIPGTVGGAVFGNAGTPKDKICPGVMADTVKSVDLLMANGKIKNGKIKTVSSRWMEFGYRESRIKNTPLPQRPIILSSVLQLKKGKKEEIKKAIKEKLTQRKKNMPLGNSAGCIFKNPPSKPAGWLIDQAGLKGKRIGGAKISEVHANYIINDQNATAKDVVELIKIAKKTVKKKFGVDLKEEIDYVGF